MSVPLSVLDLSPVVSGSTARDALRSTVDLARRVECLGYSRFWVAEHHSMPGVASAATSVLMGQVAAATATIRVGAGGVMLPNHAPLVVAEQFGTLEAFHPGRIDLGVGRAPGGSPRTTRALRDGTDRGHEAFPEYLEQLLGFFEPAEPGAVRAIPAEGNRPQPWLLGSSVVSAALAGTLGLPYAYAFHLNDANLHPALAAYRAAFRPSRRLDRPYVMVSAWVIAAETDRRARWLAGPSRLKAVMRRRGTPILLPTPEEAADHRYTDLDLKYLDGHFSSKIVGSPETVGKQLRRLVAETEADELIVTTRVHGTGDRIHSFELLAEHWLNKPSQHPQDS
ncbi:LLM class flavin-dependent oxidoreductase [Pseudonocardia eucalypti]|uniref:LLM class flavin-dependent oxidoreductase n=1 Tax=Pseudonocardia eucalypti TaxID=648755 RepID=A0ABP9RG48_9PSEU|nr:luciferase family oxidoreductase group 1 [Pseudonocardia eucalypti]